MEDNPPTATSQVASLLDHLFTDELSPSACIAAGLYDPVAEIHREIIQLVADLEERVALLETASLEARRPRPI